MTIFSSGKEDHVSLEESNLHGVRLARAIAGLHDGENSNDGQAKAASQVIYDCKSMQNGTDCGDQCTQNESDALLCLYTDEVIEE